MAKYGRGLNREILAAVNSGLITEPFSTEDVRRFVEGRWWHVPETFHSVCLANGSNHEHSVTYKKYFVSLGDGQYQIDASYRGHNWR